MDPLCMSEDPGDAHSGTCHGGLDPPLSRASAAEGAVTRDNVCLRELKMLHSKTSYPA